MENTLLTRIEVQKTLRISNSKAFHLIRSGQLPAIRVGKTYRIWRKDLEEYLSGCENTAKNARGDNQTAVII